MEGYNRRRPRSIGLFNALGVLANAGSPEKGGGISCSGSALGVRDILTPKDINNWLRDVARPSKGGGGGRIWKRWMDFFLGGGASLTN